MNLLDTKRKNSEVYNYLGHYTPSAEQFQKTLKLLDYLSIKHTYTRTIWA